MRPRYASLDHWRGFAALWVLLYHDFDAWIYAAPGWLPSGLAKALLSGWLGVDIFFVISGYCIAERAHREFVRDGSAGNFLVDRLWRIFPTYLAALVVALAILAAATVFNPVPLWSNGSSFGVLPGNFMEVLKAAFLLEPYFHQESYLAVGWTLTYELSFYMLTAVCLALSLRLRRGWPGFLLAVVLFGLSFLPSIWTNFLPFKRLPEFALGAFVWLILDLPLRKNLPIAIISAAAMWTIAGRLSIENVTSLRCAVAVALGLVLLKPFDHWLAQPPALRWLGFAGSFSYSIYLVHLPIVSKFRNLLARWIQPAGIVALWVPAAAAALALGFAWWFHQKVEAKSEALRRQHAIRFSAQSFLAAK